MDWAGLIAVWHTLVLVDAACHFVAVLSIMSLPGASVAWAVTSLPARAVTANIAQGYEPIQAPR